MKSLVRTVAGWPLACWRVVAFYFVIALLGAFQLGWALIAVVLYHVLPETAAKRCGRRFASTLYRSCFRLTRWLGMMTVDASALDAIDPDEGMIIAPNHPSVIDALILISRLENLNCIMKASVLDNVFLGAAARLAGYIRNDGPRRMLRLSTEDLKNGGQLIIFPEATRTLAAPVNPFTSGFAAMARSAGVPIQTVFIETDTPFLSKGWPILKKPKRLPLNFRVRLGKRFVIGPQDDVERFVAGMRRYFIEELDGAQLGDLWQRVVEREIDPAPAPLHRGDGRADTLGDTPSPLSLTRSRWN